MNSASACPACPKCGYERKASDTAPGWQCPSCGIAIEKYRELLAADRKATISVEEAIPAAAVDPATALPPQKIAANAEVSTQLPLGNRLGAALLDFMMAGFFLWCWIAPTALRPTLPKELGVVVLMEFFALHSSMFLAMGAGREGGPGARIMVAFVVMLFYVPVAGAFAWWHGGWWPVVGFAWLLGARVATMLAGKGSDVFEGKRARFYWGSAVAYYILFAFVVLMLPIPRLGFDWKTHYEWARYWNLRPEEVMAWGFFYFGALGLTKALEKPEWIVQQE